MTKFCRKCGRDTFWRVVGTETDCFICGYGETWDISYHHSVSKSAAGTLDQFATPHGLAGTSTKKQEKTKPEMKFKDIKFKAADTSDPEIMCMRPSDVPTYLTRRGYGRWGSHIPAESCRAEQLIWSAPYPDFADQIEHDMAMRKPLEYIAARLFQPPYMDSRKIVATFRRLNKWFGKRSASDYLLAAGVRDPMVGDLVSIIEATRRLPVSYNKVEALIEAGEIDNFTVGEKDIVSLRQIREKWVDTAARITHWSNDGLLVERRKLRLSLLETVEKQIRPFLEKSIPMTKIARLLNPPCTLWALKGYFIEIFGIVDHIMYLVYGYDTNVLTLESKLALTTPSRPLRSTGRWVRDSSYDGRVGKGGARLLERGMLLEI